jgi:hypothetical protein
MGFGNPQSQACRYCYAGRNHRGDAPSWVALLAASLADQLKRIGVLPGQKTFSHDVK